MIDYSKIKKLINEADAIIIGAGAGLSESAGICYDDEKFKTDFKEFIEKYHFKDLYSAGFYPFKTEEEKWAYWAKHIYFAYYERHHTALYQNLYNLVKDKNYFVITTNVDGQFINNGFDKSKVFEVQGSYSKLQCSVPCHNKLYDDEDMVKEMLKNTNKDLKIPSSLVPKCPVCGRVMEVNLRCDNTFVEDEIWHKLNNDYKNFISNNKDKKLLLIELGVGFNTPSIIRFPFEKMALDFNDTKLIRVNNKSTDVFLDIKDKAILINDDCNHFINQLI